MASCNFLTNHLNSLNKCLYIKFEYCLIVAEHQCTSVLAIVSVIGVECHLQKMLGMFVFFSGYVSFLHQ